jgi:hypothetical protein
MCTSAYIQQRKKIFICNIGQRVCVRLMNYELLFVGGNTSSYHLDYLK